MSDERRIVSGRLDVERVRGLLFDIDGTLSDTDDHMVDRIAHLLKPVAWLFKNKNPRRFARRFVMASETPANFMYMFADSLGIDAPIAMFYNWVSQKWRGGKRRKNQFIMIEGVREMLINFKGRFPMAVVSTRDAITTRNFLEAFDLHQYFEIVVTSQTCKHTKPYPDPVLYAAEHLGLQPENCVMIGDTIVDVRAGKSAGTQTIAVLCGFGIERELKRADADLILGCTPQVSEIL